MQLSAVVQLLPNGAPVHCPGRECSLQPRLPGRLRTKGPHDLVYREIRERSGLPAQLAVHVVSKVVDSCADKHRRTAFGAVRCDSRILRAVSLATLRGRIKVLSAAGKPQLCLLGRPVREPTSWPFYLAMVCEADDPEAVKPGGVLGVGPGQANLATDSTGERLSGAAVTRARLRLAGLRRCLQKWGTQSPRRHLRKLAGRQKNFVKKP